MNLKQVTTGEDGNIISIFKTNIKGKNDYCFAGKFLLNEESNVCQAIVKKDYSKVVIRTSKEDININTKHITPKDGEDFFVGRTGQFNINLSYSKFYEEDTEKNTKYYLKIKHLDQEQLAEQLEKEKEYEEKSKNFAVEVDFGDDEVNI